MKRVQIFFANDTTMLQLEDVQAFGLLDQHETWHNYEPGLFSRRPTRVVRLYDESKNQIRVDLAAIELLYVYSNPDDRLEHLPTHE